jgi:hypothetical protein
MVKSHKSTTVLTRHLKEGHLIYTVVDYTDATHDAYELPSVVYRSLCITCKSILQLWEDEYAEDPGRKEAETLHG